MTLPPLTADSAPAYFLLALCLLLILAPFVDFIWHDLRWRARQRRRNADIDALGRDRLGR